jgi:hypothetical protein
MTILTEVDKPAPRGLMALPRAARFAVIGVVLLSSLFQARKGLLELAPGVGADTQLTAMSQKASEATTQFLALNSDASQKGNPPRQTDPAAGPLLTTVFDVAAFRTTTAFGKSDLEALASWSLSAIQVGSVYILAGTGVTDPEKVTNDPKLIQQIKRNIAAYAPEVGRYFDTELTIDGVLAETVAANFGGADASDAAKMKEAKAKIQFGVASMIYGVIDSFNLKSISNDWRRSRLLALGYAVPKAAKLLPSDQCAELRDYARATAGAMRDPAIKRGLENVAAALKC